MTIDTNVIRQTLSMIDNYTRPEIRESLLNQLLREVGELKGALLGNEHAEITLTEIEKATKPIIEYVGIFDKYGFVDYSRVISQDKDTVTYEQIGIIKKENLRECIYTINEKHLRYWINEVTHDALFPEPTDKERSELFTAIEKYLHTDYQGGLTINLLIDAIVNRTIPGIEWMKQWQNEN